jgi:hypothetical protein
MSVSMTIQLVWQQKILLLISHKQLAFKTTQTWIALKHVLHWQACQLPMSITNTLNHVLCTFTYKSIFKLN